MFNKTLIGLNNSRLEATFNMNIEDTQVGRVCRSCLASHLNRTLQNVVFTSLIILTGCWATPPPMTRANQFPFQLLQRKGSWGTFTSLKNQMMGCRFALQDLPCSYHNLKYNPSGLILDPAPTLKQYGPRMSDNPPSSSSPALRPPAGNRARQPDFLELFTLHLELQTYLLCMSCNFLTIFGNGTQ